MVGKFGKYIQLAGDAMQSAPIGRLGGSLDDIDLAVGLTRQAPKVVAAPVAIPQASAVDDIVPSWMTKRNVGLLGGAGAVSGAALLGGNEAANRGWFTRGGEDQPVEQPPIRNNQSRLGGRVVPSVLSEDAVFPAKNNQTRLGGKAVVEPVTEAPVTTVSANPVAFLGQQIKEQSAVDAIADQEKAYRIKDGANLSYITGGDQNAIDAIVKANNIANPDLIYAGDRLVIPRGVSIPQQTLNRYLASM